MHQRRCPPHQSPLPWQTPLSTGNASDQRDNAFKSEGALWRHREPGVFHRVLSGNQDQQGGEEDGYGAGDTFGDGQEHQERLHNRLRGSGAFN